MIATSKPLVFVVEDSPDDTLLLKRAFRNSPCEVAFVQASSGEEALEYFKNVVNPGDRRPLPTPDLLLTDLKMPGLGGFDLIEWARSQPGLSKMKIAVLSGSNLETDRRKAQDLGAKHFFTKPSRATDYRELAQKILGWLLDKNAQAVVESRAPN